MKNCIIISTSFPPIGGIGVQRVTKFVKYLPQVGWNPIVLTPPTWSSKMIKDPSMLEEIPSDIQIIRPFFPNFPKFLPGEVKKMLRSMGLLNYLPDEYILWLPYLIKEIDRITKQMKIEAIYMTVPSFSLMAIVSTLKRKFGIPIIIDFRDPFTLNIYSDRNYHNDLYQRKCDLEKTCFSDADHIIQVSESIAKIYQERYPQFQDKFEFLYNGYDDADFPSTNTDVNDLDLDVLTIGYSGSVSSLVPLDPIADAILEIYKQHSIRIQLNLSTKYPYKTFSKKFKELIDHKLLLFHGFLPHKQSLENLMNSHVLLIMLLKNKELNGTFPGKAFECIRSNRPILLLNDKHSDLAQFISKTQTGITVDIDDKKEIMQALLDFQAAFKSKSFIHNPNWEEIQKYEAKNRTKQLAELFTSSSL